MNLPIRTVMIIDDNEVDIYIASRMIIKNRFAVNIIEYSSAIEALEFLQANAGNFEELPQVIFLDIYMPQMSGFDFMDCYAALPQALKSYCRVYILSSSIDAGDIARARVNADTCHFLVKPVTIGFLDQITAGSL